MYKRLFVLLLATLLIVQSIGCARQTSSGDITSSTEATTESTTETTTEETTTEEVVEELKVEDGLVYTIEGNTGDTCAERRYSVGNAPIYGFGLPSY